MDSVRGHAEAPALSLAFPRIRIRVEMGEIGARDVEPDPMALREEVARGKGFHLDLVDLPRFHERGMLPGITVARAKDAVGDVHRESARIVFVGRILVDELYREIGVGTVRGYPEFGLYRARHFTVGFQRFRLEDEDVGAGTRVGGMAACSRKSVRSPLGRRRRRASRVRRR